MNSGYGFTSLPFQGSWVDDICIYTFGTLSVPPLGARDWEVFE